MILESIAIHPAYWRRGQGGRLVQWGLKLADIVKVQAGVLAIVETPYGDYMSVRGIYGNGGTLKISENGAIELTRTRSE